jgi:hypothetical protein
MGDAWTGATAQQGTGNAMKFSLSARNVWHTLRAKPWRNILGSAAMAIGIGLVASYAVPLVLGEEFLVRQVARVYAPLMGSWHGDARRDEVSVMLVDDTSLQSAHQSWPAEYGYYARLLDAMVVYKPRAVFVDVVFAAERTDPSIARLAAAACRARAAGVQIYLAARRDAAGHFLLRPDLEALAPRCLQKVAVEYDPDAADQTAWTYPVAADSAAAEGAVRSAAGSIYRDLGGVLPPHQHAELAVNWGLQPAQRGIDWQQLPSATPHGGGHAAAEHAPHEPEAQSYCRPASHPLFEALPNFFRLLWDPAASKPVCVFHNTLYPSDLQSASDEEEKMLAQHLSGRVVMLGTALQGSNDRVLSPLHGRIPGVYMHAMALDNMLTYGDKYPRAAHLGWGTDGLRVWGLVLVGLVLIVFGSLLGETLKDWGWEHKRFKPWSPTKRKLAEAGRWALWMLFKFAIYSLFFVVMLWAGRQLSLGFLTVIHIAVFSFTAEWLEWHETFWNWLTDADAAPPGHETTNTPLRNPSTTP